MALPGPVGWLFVWIGSLLQEQFDTFVVALCDGFVKSGESGVVTSVNLHPQRDIISDVFLKERG